jgi:hypothetical protein
MCGGVAKLGCLRCYWAIEDLMKLGWRTDRTLPSGVLILCELIFRSPFSSSESSPIQTRDEFHFRCTFYYQNLVTEMDSLLHNVECIEPPLTKIRGPLPMILLPNKVHTGPMRTSSMPYGRADLLAWL